MDLADVPTCGMLRFRNKPDRIAKLREELEAVFKQGRLGPAQAARIRGKLVYASSQVSGRCGALANAALGERAGEAPGTVTLDDRTRRAVQWWISFLEVPEAREVDLKTGRLPVLLFTDGAWEQDVATVGAVLYDPEEGVVRAFGRDVPRSVVRAWQEDGKRTQVIGQAEIFPALLAKVQWRHRLQGRKVIHFVDNEAAREALVKGRSPSGPSNLLLEEYWAMEAQVRSMTWFERVPSPANPSDGPSRLDWAALEEVGGVWESPPEITEELRKALGAREDGRAGSRFDVGRGRGAHPC